MPRARRSAPHKRFSFLHILLGSNPSPREEQRKPARLFPSTFPPEDYCFPGATITTRPQLLVHSAANEGGGEREYLAWVWRGAHLCCAQGCGGRARRPRPPLLSLCMPLARFSLRAATHVLPFPPSHLSPASFSSAANMRTADLTSKRVFTHKLFFHCFRDPPPDFAPQQEEPSRQPVSQRGKSFFFFQAPRRRRRATAECQCHDVAERTFDVTSSTDVETFFFFLPPLIYIFLGDPCRFYFYFYYLHRTAKDCQCRLVLFDNPLVARPPRFTAPGPATHRSGGTTYVFRHRLRARDFRKIPGNLIQQRCCRICKFSRVEFKFCDESGSLLFKNFFLARIPRPKYGQVKCCSG